ncbi:MAG: type II secretion system protein J [Gammaproteobacteria bacterium]
MMKQQGFTLIELVIFMVIVTILGTTVFLGFDMALGQENIVSSNVNAMFMAQQRMDLMLGQRIKNGFSAFVDPCVSLFASPATDNICSKNAFAFGYTVSSTITSSWSGNANLTSIVVNVTGPGSASLSTVVGNY